MREITKAERNAISQYRPLKAKNRKDYYKKMRETQKVFAVVETKLSKREAKAINLKFKEGCTSKEAAEQLGIKRQSVNRYITSSFKKLRSIFKVNPHG